MYRLTLVAPVCVVVSRGHYGWTFAHVTEWLYLKQRGQMGGEWHQVRGSDIWCLT